MLHDDYTAAAALLQNDPQEGLRRLMELFGGPVHALSLIHIFIEDAKRVLEMKETTLDNSIESKRRRRRALKKTIEKSMNAVFFVCGAAAIAAVALITVYMVVSGLPAIREIGLLDFLFGTEWKSTAAEPKFGILPFILTSIWGTLGAIVIGVPVGLLTAVFLSKVASRRVASVVRPAVELLAGIPSVVYGLIGMMVLVPAVMELFHLKNGTCLFAAIPVSYTHLVFLSAAILHKRKVARAE